MKVAIASDHAGFHLKQHLLDVLTRLSVPFEDLGTFDEQSVDYPDYGRKVALGVAEGHFDRGVLVCGTGLGMAITANKVPSIRAITAHDVFSARMSRAHNDANILTMGERVVGPGVAEEVLRAWLETEFEGGRHQRRVDKMEPSDETVERAVKQAESPARAGAVDQAAAVRKAGVVEHGGSPDGAHLLEKGARAK